VHRHVEALLLEPLADMLEPEVLGKNGGRAAARPPLPVSTGMKPATGPAWHIEAGQKPYRG